MSAQIEAIGTPAPDRLERPRIGSTLAFVAGLLCLAGLPVAYYLVRRFTHGNFWWPFPDPAAARSQVLVGFAVAFAALALSLPAWSWKPRLSVLVERRLGPWLGPKGRRLALLLGALLLLHHWHHARGPVGDLGIWINLAKNPFIMGSEPLGRWMHYFGHRFLTLFQTPPDDLLALRLAAYVGASIWLCGLAWILPDLVPRERIASSGVFLFCAPFAIFYFGYPATTPLAYAFVGVYLLAGLRYLTLRPSRPPWPESMVLAMAIWSHGASLFATGAHAALVLIWLTSWPTEGRRANVRRLLTAAALAVIPFVLLGLTIAWTYKYGSGLEPERPLGNARGGVFQRTWILFSGSDRIVTGYHEYVFLGRDYLVGLLNLALWVYPGLLLVPVAARWLAKSRRKETLFLLSALLGLLLLTTVWNPDNGYEGDMRLLSLFSIPAGCLLLLWLVNVLDERRWKWLVALTASATFAFTIVPYLQFP